jgi:hypothetical protein
MQYLLMIFGDEQKWASVPSDQLAKVMDEYRELTQQLVRSGQFRAGARLQRSSSATTLREKDGKRITTDGPYAESKEHFGGYYVIECEHLDEALAIAGRLPGLRLGDAVEIRPVMPQSEAARLPPAR